MATNLYLLQLNAINGSHKCIFRSESENVSCTWSGQSAQCPLCGPPSGQPDVPYRDALAPHPADQTSTKNKKFILQVKSIKLDFFFLASTWTTSDSLSSTGETTETFWMVSPQSLVSWPQRTPHQLLVWLQKAQPWNYVTEGTVSLPDRKKLLLLSSKILGIKF